MSLFEQVKKDRLAARIAKDAVTTSVLTTLVGELEGLAKRAGVEVTNDSVVLVCKKFIENNDFSLSKVDVVSDAAIELKSENRVLSKYLPTQLSESDLSCIIAELNTKNVGEIMKHLKTNFAGMYDGAVASRLAKAGVQ